jgi:Holliday junction resolvase RusA-like endonuclease
MPEHYRQWKRAASSLFRQSLQPVTSYPITISIRLTGKHSRRGDIDNISGSILDALVQAGTLEDDNLTKITGLSISLSYSKAQPEISITIQSVSGGAS